MTQFRRLLVHIDPGLIVAVVLATIAAWPLLSRPSLPQFTDAEMHVYRAGEVAEAVQAGVLYPRWAPDFYYGHGYPVFNYYSPLSYHLAAWYGLLTGAGPVAGTKFVLLLAAYCGAAGMYLFARRRWGAAAGVVASAAYTFAPYVHYIDPHARGDAPETLALGLAPVLLAAFDRLPARSWRRAALAAVVLAALLLSHPLMAIIIVGLLAAWLAWSNLIVPLSGNGQTPPPARGAGRWQALAFVMGWALAAFYWLPAYLELDAVQLRNVAGPGYFDFHNYFVGVDELAAPSMLLDLGATEPAFRFNVGPAQWALAALGLFGFFNPKLRRTDSLFFAFAALGFVYLITPGSVEVWEAIPQMSYIQFPMRFLGPAALALAVLAGGAVGWARLLTERMQSLSPAVGVLACLASALPLMYPQHWGEFGPVTPLRMIEVELAGRALGTTSANDFLPVDVRLGPESQPSLLDSYETGTVDKINHAVVPEGGAATVVEHGPQRDVFEVSTPVEFVFRAYTIYFPGWTAYVDDQPVDIEVAQPDGLITFWVPAGRHEVRLELEDTRPRRLGWGVSLLGALALVGALGIEPLAMATKRRAREDREVAPGAGFGVGMTASAALPLAVAIAGFGLFKLAADAAGWFRVASSGDRVVVAQREYFAQVGYDIAFLGYDLNSVVARPGDPVPVTVYWKALAPVPANFQVFVHLIGPDGKLWGQSDKLNPADFPTTRWPLDRYVRDEHTAMLSPDAPEGSYTVVAGLWSADTGNRLYVFDAAGNALGDGVRLPQALTVIHRP